MLYALRAGAPADRQVLRAGGRHAVRDGRREPLHRRGVDLPVRDLRRHLGGTTMDIVMFGAEPRRHGGRERRLARVPVAGDARGDDRPRRDRRRRGRWWSPTSPPYTIVGGNPAHPDQAALQRRGRRPAAPRSPGGTGRSSWSPSTPGRSWPAPPPTSRHWCPDSGAQRTDRHHDHAILASVRECAGGDDA